MRKILTSIIAILAITNLAAHPAPRLVVCITVDQLRGDYLEYFRHTFGERGFKRLLGEGIAYHNVRFEFAAIDQASAFATLFTGANPNLHGISNNTQYDFNDNRERSILHDPNYLGNYTRDNYSPRNLVASTIGDELKIASLGRSDVYAIAPDPESALLSAGHAANGAFWIDNINGKWATTTYYPSIPWYVDRYNSSAESLSTRIERLAWTPALAPDRYNALPYAVDNHAFRYTFSEKALDCYPNLKTSALVNAEVNRLALQFLEYAALGARTCPDMLSITYYAGNYRRLMDKEYTLEIQDAYHRLDKDIEQLLNAIDRKVGLAHTLIVFTGSGYYKSQEDYPETLRQNGGYFYPKRCVALLNMYLMQLYGQTNWVTGYYNGQIYLNRKAVDDAKLPLEDIQSRAAAFVAEFAGVQNVVTAHALYNGQWNDATAASLYNGVHPRRCGDLIVELQPGWKINLENPGQKPQTVRNNAVITPLIFMGNGLKPQHIYREVKATEIAPTVTHILRIRPPNAARNTPLEELTVSN
ncbi:MAG: alkaline phosphatase family protein [Tannerellaceae bacterium]|jgi:arylsulfatase A-like enzyme|nr:alkaline phosphatase family protein [Tannerellaceae bacterium]